MVIQQQKRSKRVLLIGDDCVDEYQYGTVERLSPEAPVPIFRHGYSMVRPGMAGNVNENLRQLGCEVAYVCGPENRKTRLIDRRSHQHIVRIDNDIAADPVTYERINHDISSMDAIVISDYDKGVVTYELIERLRERYSGPIFVDTKKTDLARLEGCTVKINDLEYSRLKTECTDLIVTLGAQGARYRDRIYPARPIEVVDITGAGDTFLAALAYQFLEDRDMDLAIAFAIRASAVTVRHHGVYAPTLEEIS